MGITHFDRAPSHQVEVGHLQCRWTLLGEAAESITVGVRRLQVDPGNWSTPAHEHGRSEEIFYVLAGSGLSWQAGVTAAIRAGDCIVYHPRTGPHTLHAIEPLDVLAFGTRDYDESPRLPRLNLSLLGGHAIEAVSATDAGLPSPGLPIQFAREAQLGPPTLPPQPQPRPATIVNVDELAPERLQRPRVVRERRNLGRAADSRRSGLQHVEVAPGKEATPQHCHSIEEEIFVILDGEGVLVLDRDETPVGRGSVIARPAGTGVAHVLRAGDAGLTYLAYGTRDPGDVSYYPRSNKIAFRGVGVVARLQRLDYWAGED